jgi:hypothetical protein
MFKIQFALQPPFHVRRALCPYATIFPKKGQSRVERQALKAHATLVTTKGTERISNIEHGISNDEVRRNRRFFVWNVIRLSLVERLQLLES